MKQWACYYQIDNRHHRYKLMINLINVNISAFLAQNSILVRKQAKDAFCLKATPTNMVARKSKDTFEEIKIHSRWKYRNRMSRLCKNIKRYNIIDAQSSR